MRILQIIQIDDDVPEFPTSQNGHAVKLIVAALIATISIATVAWIYCLYCAATSLLDWAST